MPGDEAVAAGLFDRIIATDDLLDATSDRAWVQAMLDTEAALAWAQEDLGLVPAGTAASVAGRCRASRFDIDALSREARLGGNPVIPLVADLRAQLGPPSADWVHLGATSQDVLDTALALIAKRATASIEFDLGALCDACVSLCDRHRSTLMVGRTLLQHALPITFGLKSAGWLVAADEGRRALRRVREGLPIQLGGAAGTLASMGERGVDVQAALASALGLVVAPLPWHSNRVVVADLAATLGVLVGISSKIARDIALMMQTEVGEAFEPAAPGRGGSSALPHKRNPVSAAAVSSAHHRAAALVSVVMGSMAHEHERAIGGWQAEWETLTSLLRLAGGAVRHVAETVGGLEVDVDAMARNLARRGGVILSERIVHELAPDIGRAEATRLVRAAADRAAGSGRDFATELLDEQAIRSHLSADRLSELLEPSGYLGSADAFIDRALRSYRGE